MCALAIKVFLKNSSDNGKKLIEKTKRDLLKIQFSRVPPEIKKFSKKKIRKTGLENPWEQAHAKFQLDRSKTVTSTSLRTFGRWVLLNVFFCTTSLQIKPTLRSSSTVKTNRLRQKDEVEGWAEGTPAHWGARGVGPTQRPPPSARHLSRLPVG